jgi:hypothetical protein
MATLCKRRRGQGLRLTASQPVSVLAQEEAKSATVSSDRGPTAQVLVVVGPCKTPSLGRKGRNKITMRTFRTMLDHLPGETRSMCSRKDDAWAAWAKDDFKIKLLNLR